MRRIPSLDILRGFALCGILFVNAPAMLRLSTTPNGTVDPVVRWLEFGVYHRFFPLFSVLFGIGFALMWQSARRRTASPRLVLLRRILALGVLGVLHQLLQPGEALLPYAIVALTLLLPATFLPTRWAVPATAAVGGVCTVAAVTVGSGPLMVPGLFLLGFAAGTAELPRRVEQAGSWVPPLLLALLTPAAVVAVMWQSTHPGASVGAGLLLAAVYACAVSMLVHTRSGVIGGALTALGRTALTNYLAATLIVVAVRVVAEPLGLGSEDDGAWDRTLVLCAIILALQATVSMLWLKRFDQGPVEWLVRRLTWAGAAPAADMPRAEAEIGGERTVAAEAANSALSQPVTVSRI
ncbi:DUF418 domain-containing protein [Nocardia sp. 2]|uniref:DUF418 domain-containing protein n=1 Tax=Nocardia acididurans TaxID=2802282 RepID=A0ABS1MHY6_9NOCA|nr:DUF418 domain-containing protein [Nocardia acididurans]MBL1079660.1 DUF418 domain-containing protein [Nocardia acididurans]